MKHHHIAIFDIDGTLFDPDIRLLAAPLYNHRSYHLLKKHNATIIVSTGRRKWIKTNDLQLHALGMYPPDHIVTGIGTAVLHKRFHYVYAEDQQWKKYLLTTGWDKAKISAQIESIVQKWRLVRIPTSNQFTLTFWLVNRPLADIEQMRTSIEKGVKNIKTVITEQLLLPNTKDRFSGYLFVIPDVAGKDLSSLYLLDMIRKDKPNTHFHIHVFGDALVDVPMLTMDYPHSTIHAHGLHLTPQAKIMLKQMNAHHVMIHPGSAPATIYESLKLELREAQLLNKAQNSPYRPLIAKLEPLLDHMIAQHLSPDDITQNGVVMVIRASQILYSNSSSRVKRMSGFLLLVRGYCMDVFDGVRARRRPELKSQLGATLDATSDRQKEYAQLTARHDYSPHAIEAALSCLLPSISRAQAESEGILVPEKDKHGGSALSRVKNLIIIALLDLIGLRALANRQQDKLYRANIATYLHRMSYIESFHDEDVKAHPEAKKRYTTLVELLTEYSKKSKGADLPPQLQTILNKYV